MSEHIMRRVVATGAALAAIGGGAVGLVGCSGGGEGGSPQTTEFKIDQGELGAYCDTDVLAPGQYKAAIGKNLTFPNEALPKSNDLSAIREEASREIAKNPLGLAVAKTLIENQTGDANFGDIQKRAENTFQVIIKDEEKRKEACGVVVSAFMTKGQRTTITGTEYVEISPTYVGDDINPSVIEFNPHVQPNATQVDGFWIQTDPGNLPVAITPEGRGLISKTLGNETGTTDLDPNGTPQTFIDQDGNQVTVEVLPNGEKRTTKTAPNGETVTQTGTGGSGSGKEGGGTGCAICGGVGCPVCKPKAPDTPAPTTPPQTTPNTTAPPQTTPNTTTPTTTPPPTTLPKGSVIPIDGAPN